MRDPDLFGGADGGSRVPGAGGAASGPRAPAGAGESGADVPLAARMRPRRLDEFVGQEHLLGQGKPLRSMIEAGRLASMIFWGPPGSGKTTLAHLLAGSTDAAFVPFSAVTEGIARVRQVIAEARERERASGRRTILFCDEIHRFNKAQQDAFLPHVEDGTIVLIGATTENPSFEVIRPLLSRAPVFVLEPLSPPELTTILSRALDDAERGLGDGAPHVEPDVLALIAGAADGDARRALGVLASAARIAGAGGRVDRAVVAEAVQHRFAVYDKSGEEHYNLISALHKAIRGSDPDAALYWLARMLEGGEDPLYVARRLVRMASEDVGMADPGALQVAVAARDAFHFLGTPEGELALAEAAVYLATSPKSNRVYAAWGRARKRARETASEPVPLHIRNAPTALMKDLGYGRGYRYDPDEPEGMAPQTYLPEALLGERLYEPGPFGHEATVAKRLAWWAERRRCGAADRGPTKDADRGPAADADRGPDREPPAPGGAGSERKGPT